MDNSYIIELNEKEINNNLKFVKMSSGKSYVEDSYGPKKVVELKQSENKIDELLDNDAFYSCVLILLIIYATFSTGPNKVDQTNKLDKYIKLRFDIPLVKILFILSVLLLSLGGVV
jgi:hypothetical protein